MTKWHDRSMRRFDGLFPTEEGIESDSEKRFNSYFGGSPRRLSPNIYRFMVNFWKQAVMADEPVVSYDGSDRASDLIDRVMPSVNAAVTEAVGDLIRYGCGVIVNRKELACEAVDPRYWFPVRSAFDQNDGDIDILAYPYSDDSENDASPNKIAIFRFAPGQIIESHHAFNGGTIGAMLSEVSSPGSIVPVSTISSDSTLFGRSDYSDVDIYIAELFRRESAVSCALDQQASPHLALPETAIPSSDGQPFSIDPRGMVIPLNADQGQPPQYVSWNPSFDGQTEAIKRAEQRIYQLVGISQILIEPQIRSAALTGAALRRLAAPTVSKIRLIRGRLDKVIKAAIIGQASLLARTGGEVIDINEDQIEVLWRPELSGGLSDESDALSTLIGAGVISQEMGIMIATGLNARQAAQQADSEQDSQEMVRMVNNG